VTSDNRGDKGIWGAESNVRIRKKKKEKRRKECLNAPLRSLSGKKSTSTRVLGPLFARADEKRKKRGSRQIGKGETIGSKITQAQCYVEKGKGGDTRLPSSFTEDNEKKETSHAELLPLNRKSPKRGKGKGDAKYLMFLQTEKC